MEKNTEEESSHKVINMGFWKTAAIVGGIGAGTILLYRGVSAAWKKNYVRLGLLGGTAAIILASSAPKLTEKYIEYRAIVTQNEHSLDSLRIVKDYDLKGKQLDTQRELDGKKIDKGISTDPTPITSQPTITPNQTTTSQRTIDNKLNSDNGKYSLNTSARTSQPTKKYSASVLPEENREISHYFIDLDRSDRELKLFTVYSDGKKFLAGTYAVSIARDGGPSDRQNTLIWNIAPRSGRLYPGVIKIDPSPNQKHIVITGAGQNNEHYEEIYSRAAANNSGIRMRNSNYKQLERIIKGHTTYFTSHF